MLVYVQYKEGPGVLGTLEDIFTIEQESSYIILNVPEEDKLTKLLELLESNKNLNPNLKNLSNFKTLCTTYIPKADIRGIMLVEELLWKTT